MKAIEEFLKVVENEEFVEGHEVLETQWHLLKKIPEMEDEAKILKGLINASTALALACKGKVQGALQVWQTYEQQTHHQYSHENRRTEEEPDAYIKIRSGSTIAKHPVLTQP